MAFSMTRTKDKWLWSEKYAYGMNLKKVGLNWTMTFGCSSGQDWQRYYNTSQDYKKRGLHGLRRLEQEQQFDNRRSEHLVKNGDSELETARKCGSTDGNQDMGRMT